MATSKDSAKTPNLLEFLVDEPILLEEWLTFSDLLNSNPQDKRRWSMQLFSKILNSWVLKNPNATIHDLSHVVRKMSSIDIAEKIESNFGKNDLISFLLDHQTKQKQGELIDNTVQCGPDVDKSGTIEALEKVLSSIEKRNTEKLNMKIFKAIDECQKVYNSKMNSVFPKHEASNINPVTLKKHHDNNLFEACKLLEFKLQEVKEPFSTKKYLETLQQQILSVWEEISLSNLSRKDEEIRKNKVKEYKRMEAEKPLKQQEIATAGLNKEKKSINLYADVVSFFSQNNASISTKPDATPRIDFDLNRELLPIAIELGFQKTRVGWMNDNCFKPISNCWGMMVTPNKLGITDDDEVVIGEEVNRRNVIMMYHLDKVLMDKEDTTYHWSSKDWSLPVEKAFLTGLFLSRIKSDVEEILQGRWTTAVITVPLWYTSVQRLNTKDAAQIAGFSKVHLINETSAAALAFVNDPMRQQYPNENHVLVTVAGDDHFDAAIYEYGHGKIKMVSSCGDLHCSQQSSFFDQLKIKSKFGRTSGESFEDSIGQLFKDMVGKTKDRIKQNLFIDTGHTIGDDSKTLLRSGTELYGRPYTKKMLPSADFILFGAAIFAESTSSRSEDVVMFVTDIGTYSFQRKLSGSGAQQKLIFSYPVFDKTEITCVHTINLKPCEQTMLEIQEVSKDKAFPVGRLVLHPLNDSIREIQARFFLNKESIFRAEVYINDQDTEVKLNAEWISSNINEEEKQTYASMVESLKNQRKELLQKSKMVL